MKRWDQNAIEAGADRLLGKAKGWNPIPVHLYPKERNFINLRGQRIGLLVFEEYLGKLRKNRTGRWLALCDCGRHTIMHKSTQNRPLDAYRCDVCYTENTRKD